MRKNVAGYLLAAMVFLLTVLPARAAESPRIVGLKQDGDELLAWARGAENGGEVTAMLGRTPAESAVAQTFMESGMVMRTLILIDNSLSIPEENRTEIRDRLLELVAAKRENEYYSLGTISDHVTILLEFTKDYMQLRDAFNTLEYQYQDTFITDALYDYLAADPFGESVNSFERILLISDGMDNKSLGYTKDELRDVLKDSPLPIYAIGVGGGNDAMNAYLENMFALARTTNGDSLLLSDLNSGVDNLITMMGADLSSLVVTVNIPESVQDGSLQTLSLQFGEGGPTAFLDNIRMPLLAEQPPTTEPEPTPASEPEPTAAPEPEPSSELESEKKSVNVPMLMILGAAVLVVIVLVTLLLRKRKKKSESNDARKFERPKPEPTQTPRPEQQESRPVDHRTVLVDGAASSGVPGGRKTVRILNQRPIYSIMLRDVHNPERIYQKTIEKSLTIGALSDADICINYDSTVSGQQCELILEGNDLYLINHSRSNITELNGQVVNQKMRLVSGSVIKMGLVEMSVTFQF